MAELDPLTEGNEARYERGCDMEGLDWTTELEEEMRATWRDWSWVVGICAIGIGLCVGLGMVIGYALWG